MSSGSFSSGPEPWLRAALEFKERLRHACAFEHPYSAGRGLLSSGRPASVLMLWGLSSRLGEGFEPHVLLVKRSETVGTHQGQMAFPGGARDASDHSVEHTALREAHEEVGILEDQIEILGTLPVLWTPTGFQITPVLGWVREPFEDLDLRVDGHELSQALWVSRSRLLATYRRESRQWGAIRYPTEVFLEEPYRVWGATGAILKNLLERLERLG
ncbi:MAG: hypothetical protein RJB38_984 [Pseudomonadota bacterium]|jgi:8-oxo-dGTP pyrophosphatase MutT (NUDIX family)